MGYEFRDRLKKVRERSGLTQAELERRAELPAMLISQYETGTRKPGLDNLISIIRGLGCTANDLLGDHSE